MSDRVGPDGFVPVEPAPKKTEARPAGNRALKGCLIALAVVVVLLVVAVATCGYLVRRSVVDDPAEAERVARAMASYTAPDGYAAQGAVRIPAIGQVVFLGLPGDTPASVPTSHEIMMGRFDVEMSEKQALDALAEASGQNTDGSQFKSVRCTVAGRSAACIDGEGSGEPGEPSQGSEPQNERFRYQAVFVVVGQNDIFVAAVFSGAASYDPKFAQTFFDSLQIKPK
jgi:hypothetical protein